MHQRNCLERTASLLARCIIGCLVLLTGWCARAVILEPIAIEALAQQAEIVLRGKVLSKTVQRDASGRIYTQVELEVIEIWKGAISGTPFVVVHGGGILGDQSSTVGGQVEYTVGEEVVAFLARNERGEGVTLGLCQGKFSVWKDAKSGLRYATNPFHGLPGEAAGAVARHSLKRSVSPSASLPLDTLREKVQEALP